MVNMSKDKVSEQNMDDGQSRPWMLSLAFKDRGSLASAYMPFIKGGGLFIPTSKSYELGESVFVLLTLEETAQKFPLTGKVVWVSPPQAQQTRPVGVGVQFPQDEEGLKIKVAIEQIIDNIQSSLKKTHTL